MFEIFLRARGTKSGYSSLRYLVKQRAVQRSLVTVLIFLMRRLWLAVTEVRVDSQNRSLDPDIEVPAAWNGEPEAQAP